MGTSNREHVIDRLHRIQDVITLLSSKEYVTNNPLLVLDFLTNIIKLLFDRIKNIEDDDDISLRRVENFSQMIHFYLDDVEHIKTTNIPMEIISIINDILIDNKITHNILYRPDTDFNYYFVNFSHNLREEFTHIGKLPDSKLGIIGFPLSERSNTLLNCLLIHEIGHILCEELKIIENIPNKYLEISKKDISSYYAALKKQVDEFKRTIPLEKARLEDFYIDEDADKRRLIEDINNIFGNWLNEIIADLIAFHYFGLPYLLSLSEYSLVYKGPEFYTDLHPPLFLRLKILFKLYHKKEYSKKIKKYGNITKYVSKYKKIARNTFKNQSRFISAQKYYIIEKKIYAMSNDLLDIVEKFIVIKKTEFIQARIEYSIDSFLSFIPPVEYISETKTIHTLTPFIVLNAAWIVKENYKTKLYECFPEDNHAGRVMLNKLTCKALELINFRSKMRGE